MTTKLIIRIQLPQVKAPALRFALACLYLISGSFTVAQEPSKVGFDARLISGHPISVGGNNGVGPLASIGISSTPLGSAYIFGGERPDIFVSSDRWYPGFHLYRWLNDTTRILGAWMQNSLDKY